MPLDQQNKYFLAQQTTTTQTPESSNVPSQLKGPRGFQNLGNTCYMNSFIQMLYNITPLRDSLISLELNQKSNIKNLKMSLYQLQRLFVMMTTFSKK